MRGLPPLQIVFPAHALDGFSCHQEEVRAAYKHKHLKAAFTNVAQKEAWSTKVGGRVGLVGMLCCAGGGHGRDVCRHRPRGWLDEHGLAAFQTAHAHPPTHSACLGQVSISARGVLKVTHMLTLAGGPLAPPLEAQPLLGTFTSQAAPQRTCVVQFVVLPAEDAEGGGVLGADEDMEGVV